MDGKKDKDNVYLTVSVLPFHPTAPDIMSWRCHERITVKKTRRTDIIKAFLELQVKNRTIITYPIKIRYPL